MIYHIELVVSSLHVAMVSSERMLRPVMFGDFNYSFICALCRMENEFTCAFGMKEYFTRFHNSVIDAIQIIFIHYAMIIKVKELCI